MRRIKRFPRLQAFIILMQLVLWGIPSATALSEPALLPISEPQRSFWNDLTMSFPTGVANVPLKVDIRRDANSAISCMDVTYGASSVKIDGKDLAFAHLPMVANISVTMELIANTASIDIAFPYYEREEERGGPAKFGFIHIIRMKTVRIDH